MTSYKTKLTDLETKLKEFRKKEKEQESLMKIVETQRTKISQLGEEINRIKNQKVQLHKKMREDQESYEKFKTSRQKEITEIKRKNLEKDAMISKLKTENKKKDLMYKKKTEELLSKYMSQDLLKQIRSGNQGSSQKSARKHLNNSSFMEEPNILSEVNSNNTISEEEAQNLIQYCTERLLDNLDLSHQIEREEENLKSTEHYLEIERNKYSEIILKREKYELEKKDCKDLEVEQTLETRIQECDFDLTDVQNTIDTLEEKLEFQLGKINETTKRLASRPHIIPEQLLLNNDKLNRNPMNYQLILRCFLAKYINCSLDNMKMQERIGQNSADISELKKRLEETEQKSKLADLQYEINLTKLTKEYERNQMLLFKQQGFEDEENEHDKENVIDSDITEAKLNELTTLSQARTRRSMNANPDKSGNNMTRISSSKFLEIAEAHLPDPKKDSMNPNNLKIRGAETAQDQIKRLEKVIGEMVKKQ